jgi:hypothetical protein
MKFIRVLIGVQATYIFLTALWPLIDIHSFMLVTGYKTDVWLVKTVGALLIPISLTMGSYLIIRADERPLIILGGGTAVSFICVDFYYALGDVISDIYLLDGVLQIGFVAAWIYVLATHKK